MPLSSATIHEIASFALEGVSLDRLPPDVVTISREMMVNAAAVGLAGAAQQEGNTVTRLVQEMGGNGKCTIIGKGLRTSPVYAALVNGVLIHLLDFDDEIAGNNGARPASAVFPVVMAIGEMNGSPGKEVLEAFVAGCEIASKLSNFLVQHDNAYARDTAHTVGAAVASARLLNLDMDRIKQAIRLTGSTAFQNGSYQSAGPVRAYGQGRAAMSGVMAAMLVHQGFNPSPPGDQDPGGRHNWSPDLDPDSEAIILESLGSPFDVISPGVALKLYPCASPAHTVIDASLQLIQQYRVSVDQIAAVRVGVAATALEAMPFSTPLNGWEARYCISYIVASSLTHGHPLIDNFTDAAVQDTRVRTFMDRITVEATEAPSTSIPYPAAVAIALNDGRQLQHRAEFARGQPQLPLTSEELDAKFLYCSRYILPPDHIEEAVTRLRDLENIENSTGLFSVLGG